MRPIRKLKWRKWEPSSEEGKFPQPRVLSASLCRSLKTLHARGLVTKRAHAWHLTTEGLATAREINQKLGHQIEKLRHKIEELNGLKYLE